MSPAVVRIIGRISAELELELASVAAAVLTPDATDRSSFSAVRLAERERPEPKESSDA